MSDEATRIANEIVGIGGQVTMPILPHEKDLPVTFSDRRILRDRIRDALDKLALDIAHEHGYARDIP